MTRTETEQAVAPMRIVIVLLLPFIVASCGTDFLKPDYADSTNPCFKMHGNRTVKNGGDEISIYLGRVKSQWGVCWRSTPYHPFEIGDPNFEPWVGYAAGFAFTPPVPAIEEFLVSFNGMTPVRYRRLKLNVFTVDADEYFWVPPSFPSHGFRAPELPQGDYRIQVLYRANGRVLHARWHITYRPPGDHKAPLAPTCSIDFQSNSSGLIKTIRRDSKRTNTSWVATADKHSRSLRSVSLAPPCHDV